MPFIKLENVDYQYDKNSPMVFENINISIEKDEIVGIEGSNGSGKTTLGKLMLGMILPSKGNVLVNGYSTSDIRLVETSKTVGYVFQNPNLHFFCRTVREEVEFFIRFSSRSSCQEKARVDFFLDYFDLKKCENMFPLMLSYGEKQRLALAIALLREPQFLILDEPSTGLDPARKDSLITYLNKIAGQGKGMCIISHDRVFLDKLINRKICIENHKVISDVYMNCKVH